MKNGIYDLENGLTFVIKLALFSKLSSKTMILFFAILAFDFFFLF